MIKDVGVTRDQKTSHILYCLVHYYIIMDKYVYLPERVIKSYVKYLIIDLQYKANVFIISFLL